MHKKAFFATLLDVEIGGAKHRVLPRDVQFDPVYRQDPACRLPAREQGFQDPRQRAGGGEERHASPGIKRGGVLNLVRHEIEFLCDPDNIPQQVMVDIDRPRHRRLHPHQQRQAAEGCDPDQPRGDFTVAASARRPASRPSSKRRRRLPLRRRLLRLPRLRLLARQRALRALLRLLALRPAAGAAAGAAGGKAAAAPAKGPAKK